MSLNTATLEKSSYPLMMHLGITPQHETAVNKPSYNPECQTSNISSEHDSWCLEVSATGRLDGSIG